MATPPDNQSGGVSRNWAALHWDETLVRVGCPWLSSPRVDAATYVQALVLANLLGVTMTVNKIEWEPQFVEDGEREASAWPGLRARLCRACRIMSSSVVIAASRCSSEPRIISLPPPDRDSGAARRRRGLALLPDANHVRLIVTLADANGQWRTFSEAAPPLHQSHQRKGSAGPAIFSRLASAR